MSPAPPNSTPITLLLSWSAKYAVTPPPAIVPYAPTPTPTPGEPRYSSDSFGLYGSVAYCSAGGRPVTGSCTRCVISPTSTGCNGGIAPAMDVVSTFGPSSV